MVGSQNIDLFLPNELIYPVYLLWAVFLPCPRGRGLQCLFDPFLCCRTILPWDCSPLFFFPQCSFFVAVCIPRKNAHHSRVRFFFILPVLQHLAQSIALWTSIPRRFPPLFPLSPQFASARISSNPLDLLKRPASKIGQPF